MANAKDPAKPEARGQEGHQPRADEERAKHSLRFDSLDERERHRQIRAHEKSELELPVQIVYPDARLMSPRLRVFIDALREHLLARPEIHRGEQNVETG